MQLRKHILRKPLPFQQRSQSRQKIKFLIRHLLLGDRQLAGHVFVGPAAHQEQFDALNFPPLASGPPALDGEPHPYRDVVPFARRLVETFPDRVLWGTDWPHPNLKNHMPDDGLLVDYIPSIAVTPELQQTLLVDNPLRLYWS